MNHNEKIVSGEANTKTRYYAVQTFTGEEEILVRFLRERIDKALMSEAFVPRRQMNRRFNGEWQTVQEVLFPGYLFIVTDNAEELFLQLKNIPKMSVLLHDDEYTFIALSENETDYLNRIGSARGDHTMRISKVAFDTYPYKKGDKVSWIEGDLTEFEGEIVGFDLRKRKAIIHTELFGGCDMHVGIEIVNFHHRYMME